MEKKDSSVKLYREGLNPREVRYVDIAYRYTATATISLLPLHLALPSVFSFRSLLRRTTPSGASGIFYSIPSRRRRFDLRDRYRQRRMNLSPRILRNAPLLRASYVKYAPTRLVVKFDTQLSKYALSYRTRFALLLLPYSCRRL